MLRTFVLYAVSKENVESSKRKFRGKKEKENKNVHMIILERDSAVGRNRALETLRSLEIYIDT